MRRDVRTRSSKLGSVSCSGRDNHFLAESRAGSWGSCCGLPRVMGEPMQARAAKSRLHQQAASVSPDGRRGHGGIVLAPLRVATMYLHASKMPWSQEEALTSPLMAQACTGGMFCTSPWPHTRVTSHVASSSSPLGPTGAVPPETEDAEAPQHPHTRPLT